MRRPLLFDFFNVLYRSVLKFTWLLTLLTIFSCSAPTGKPDTRQINFALLEDESLLTPAERTGYAYRDLPKMENKVRDYLVVRFPPGYPLPDALIELEKGGAVCYYDTDPEDTDKFVCDFSRPGYGVIGHFFIDLDWTVILHFDLKNKEIIGLDVFRSGSSM